MKYRYQFASDVKRDGLGLELTDENWKALADVFRCDADNSLTISVSGDALPFTKIVRLMRMARKEFGPFEDETLLPDPLN